MKNMKKIAALGMSAVMVAGMMAGCGSSIVYDYDRRSLDDGWL